MRMGVEKWMWEEGICLGQCVHVWSGDLVRLQRWTPGRLCAAERHD